MAITPQRRAVWIMAAFSATEGLWVAVNLYASGWRFVRYLGFAPDRAGTAPGWIAAAVVTAIYVGYARRLPSVRETMFQLTPFKLLAFSLAVFAGILEEVIFRKWVMDDVAASGFGIIAQIAASGLVFGAIHAVWGLMGRSLPAAIGAMVATGTLGVMLGIVYVLGGRSLAPCIASHFLINVLIEPGLMLAATRGEMRRLRPVSSPA
jgi:membrane protease YdiL (CAAX protease family)